MAEPRPLSSNELAELPDWMRQQIEQYDVQYGQGNRSSWTMYQNWIGKQEQPESAEVPRGFIPPHGPRVTSQDIISKRNDAWKAERETNLLRGMDDSEAGAQAARKVDYWTSVARDVTGAPSAKAGAPVERLATMDPTTALWESLKPQDIQTAEAAARQRQADDERKTRATSVRKMIRGQALRQVKSTQPKLGGNARIQAVDAAEKAFINKHLSTSRQQFYEESFELARGIISQEQRKTVLIPGQEGYEEQPKELKEEHWKLSSRIAQQMIKLYESEVFPELAEERMGGKGGQIAFKIPGVGRVANLEFEEGSTTERILKTAGEVGRSLMVSEDEEGRIVETPVSTAMRDVGGIIRLATDPVMRAISFDVDAEGNVLDPDDPNYKLYKIQEKALKDIAAGEGSLLDYAAAYTGFFPYAMASNIDATDRPRMDTGSWLRDAAISIAQGRYLGDDFMELTATTTFYEKIGAPWFPMAAGMAVEIALPLTPLSAVRAPVRAALTGFAGGARIGSESMARFMNRFRVPGADTITRIGKSTERGFHNINHPVEWAQHRILYNEARNIQKGIDAAVPAGRAEGTITGPVRAADEVDIAFPHVLARRYAGEIVSGIKAGVKFGFKQGTEAARLVDEAESIVTRLDRAMEVGTDVLRSDPQGLEILDEVAALSAAGMRPTDPLLRTQVAQNMMARRFEEHFANIVPNDLVVIADNVLMRSDAYQKIKKSFNAELNAKLVAHTDTATGERTFVNNKSAVEAFNDGFGVEKVNENAYLSDIRTKIFANEGLNGEQYKIAFDAAKRGIARRLHETVRVTREGPAIRRAEQQVTRRAEGDLFGYQNMRPVEDLYRAAKTFFSEGTPPAMPKMTDRTARPVSEMLRGAQAELIEIDRILVKKLQAAKVEAAILKDEVDIPLPAGRQASDESIDILMREASSDDPIADVLKVLELFFGKDFGGVDKTTMRQILERSGKFKTPGITRRSVRDAIDVLRRNEETFRTTTRGLGSRAVPPVRNIVGLMKNRGFRNVMDDIFGKGKWSEIYRNLLDAPDAAVFGWLLAHERKLILGKHVTKFTETHPEFLFRLGGRDVQDMELFRLLAPKHGVPPQLVEGLGRAIFGGNRANGALDPSDFKEIIEQIMGDLFQHGGIGPDFTKRVSDAVLGRISAKIIRSSSLKAVARREANRIISAEMPAGAAVSSAQKAQIDELVEAEVKKVIERTVPAIVEAATEMNLDRIIGQLSAMGLPITKSKAAMNVETTMRPELLRMEGDYGVFVSNGLHSSAELGVLKDAFESSAVQNLQKNFEHLALRDAPLHKWAWGMASWWVQTFRRGAIGGLLGGFPMLGSRFAGLNNLSAPFITAITAPSYVAAVIKAMPSAAARLGRPVATATEVVAKKWAPSRKMYNWGYARHVAKKNEVAVVGVDGKVWTHGDIEQEIARNNVRFSQASFEFQNIVLEDMRRAAATSPNLFTSNRLSQTWAWLNPANKNVWNIFAEESDMAFREAVFVEGLRRGHTAAEASTLAQNVLLNYGAISGAERSIIARHMLFYAFKRQMGMEVMKNLLRGDAGTKALVSQIRFLKNQHDEAGTWSTEADYARARLWAKMGKTYDGVASAHYGLSVPGIESFNLLTNILYTAIDPNRMVAPRVLREVGEEVLATPVLQFLVDVATSSSGRFDKGERVDPRFVVFLMNFGMWSWVQDAYDIKAVGVTRRRPGEPTFAPGTRQYEFASKGGAIGFRATIMAATYVGIIRNIKDGTDAGIRGGLYPEGTVVKRRGDGSIVLYLASLDTNMALPTEFQVQARIAQQIDNELGGMISKTQPIED